MSLKKISSVVNEVYDTHTQTRNVGSASYRQNFYQKWMMKKMLKTILYEDVGYSLSERDLLLRDSIVKKAMSYRIQERANIFLELVSFLRRLEILNAIRKDFEELSRVSKFNPVVQEIWMEFKDDPNYILTPSGEIINQKEIRGMYNVW